MIFSRFVRQPTTQYLRVSRFSRSLRSVKARQLPNRQTASFPLRMLSGAAFTAGVAYKTLKIGSAECREKGKGSTGITHTEQKGNSTWETFLYVLRKEWLNLLIALTTALAVAVCQAMMPVYLEDVISTLRNVLWSSPFAAHNVHPIAFRLIVLCVAQSISSVLYIVALVKISKNSSDRQYEEDLQSTAVQDVSEQ